MNFDRMRALVLEKAALGRLVQQIDSEPEVLQLGEELKLATVELPSKWKWVRLSYLTTEMGDGPFGSNLKKEHYTSQPEVRIIQLSNIGERGWRNENVKYTTFTHAETIRRSKVDPGDIVIAKMMPAGRAIIVPEIEQAFILSSDAVKVVVNKELCLTQYLNIAINSSVFKNQVYANVQGTTRIRTSVSKLKNFFVPLPSLEEQARIVEKVNEVFAEIDRAEKAYQELQMLADVLRGQILQEAIQGKLVPQLDSEEEVQQIGDAPKEVPFVIPEKWKWKTLKSITGTITDGTHHSPKNSQVKDEIFKNLYVTAKNIKYTGVDLSKPTYVDDEVHAEIVKRCDPAFGDVLFVKDGATTGVVTVNDLHDSFSMLSSVALIKTLPEVLDSQYLVYVLRSPIIEKVIRSKMKGTGIPRVTLKILQSIPIPVPPFDEQLRIVGKVHDLLKQVDALSGK